MKEQSLSDARKLNKKHVQKFRAGEQDARDDKGPVSATPAQVKKRRRGGVSGMRSPSPSGGM
jgi:hypothetical protein